MKTSRKLALAVSMTIAAGWVQAQNAQPLTPTPYANTLSSDQEKERAPISAGEQLPPSHDRASRSPQRMQSASAAEQSETIVAAVQPQTENGITYLCGGVGAEEARYMKQAARDYGLMLTFASRSGEYLADVDVAIHDAKGRSVLNASCDGPIMLVDFERSGTYRVQAQAADYALNRTVQAKAKGRTQSIVMAWPPGVLAQERIAASQPSAQMETSGDSGAESRQGQGSDAMKNKMKHHAK